MVKRGQLVAGVCAVLLALGGCGKSGEPPPQGAAPAGGAPPGGKPVYQVSLTGYVSKVYDCDHQLCVNASKASLQRLGLRVNEESGGLFKKHFDVEGADGTSAAVDVVELGKTSSRVSIKVGYLLGDRDAAERIHSEIEGEVGARRGQSIQTTGDWGAAQTPGAAPTTLPPRTPPQTFWAQPAAPPPPPPQPYSPPTTRPAPPPTLPPAPPPPPPPPPPPTTIAPAPPRPTPPAPGAPGPAAGWD